MRNRTSFILLLLYFRIRRYCDETSVKIKKLSFSSLVKYQQMKIDFYTNPSLQKRKASSREKKEIRKIKFQHYENFFFLPNNFSNYFLFVHLFHLYKYTFVFVEGLFICLSLLLYSLTHLSPSS